MMTALAVLAAWSALSLAFAAGWALRSIVGRHVS